MSINKSILFILFFTGLQSLAQEKTVTRLDNSKISFEELDYKIKTLMNAASVQGLAITIFNNRKLFTKKLLATSE